MAPPWVMFDNAAVYGGTCKGSADPADIAGVGVVLSFVLASIMTTTASILAMVLDHCFDSKGQWSFRTPIKSFRERFLDTEWKKDYAWRPFLDPLIIGLGDQQLVVQGSFVAPGAHFVLVLYICGLSSSSHLAALITLRKYFRKYKLIAKVRLSLFLGFALFLLSSMVATIAMPQTVGSQGTIIGETPNSRVRRLCFIIPMFFILIGFSTALTCILSHPQKSSKSTSNLKKRTTDSSVNPMKCLLPATCDHDPFLTHAGKCGLVLLRYLFFNPLIAFIVQILLAILSVVLVLSQKFSPPDDPKHWCGLQDGEENAWGFGQTLSVVMLLLPAMSAGQTYLEARHAIQKDS
ncbi:hypothetical protein EJ04DRAFT_591904 [Polyplosphaeria fusca]|uniref:Uncharacterized protein n=1 Tax=Polyplosphaeria fusca TaxID=682080 RepID=A0A9P4UTX9_9PLEO|nr:hypothetical protein EJ04DRAFT_591904 [Polyplosphaeria fusca]